MCGIHLVAGVEREQALVATKKMVSACSYRGPDENTTVEFDDVAMGFNRLQIVGGENGKQPISNEDGSLVIVGNGEVFNYRDLKSSHEKPHDYGTESDIEVLLHLYEEQGINFLGRIEGQFSVAIYDKNLNKIILARDRWGITPIFFSQQNRHLIVSSSAKAIIDTGLIDVRLDPIGLAESWSLYGPTPPRTCFDSISQLPPGCYAEYDQDTGELAIRPYLPEPSNTALELRDALQESVIRRMQGEHGLGVYVSGGVDSSIIAALANKAADSKPILFGISFKEAAYDESRYQRILARYLDCELRTVLVDVEDIIDNISKCVRFAESPLIRTAPVPMMLLSKEVRRAGIKFVLCGEGADELFAGYPVFSNGKSSVSDKWRELSIFNECFVSNKVVPAVQISFENVTGLGDGLAGIRNQEIATKLSRYLLVNQGDRMAMANSVEQRFPFLDNKVYDVAFSLKHEELVTKLGGKLHLRQAFADILPEELINRRKQGFLSPDFLIAKTLLERGVLQSTLNTENCKRVGIFKYSKIKEILNNMDSEAKGRFLIFAYSTHLLHRLVLEGSHEDG